MITAGRSVPRRTFSGLPSLTAALHRPLPDVVVRPPSPLSPQFCFSYCPFFSQDCAWLWVCESFLPLFVCWTASFAVSYRSSGRLLAGPPAAHGCFVKLALYLFLLAYIF